MIPFAVLLALSLHLASAAADEGRVAFASLPSSQAHAGAAVGAPARDTEPERKIDPQRKTNPGARASFALASLHEKMGHPLLAISALKEASRQEAARRESLMEMARIYGDLGQEWPALDCYLRAADLGEGRAVAGMVNIGKRLYSRGDVARANGVFALVRTAFPDSLADSLADGPAERFSKNPAERLP